MKKTFITIIGALCIRCCLGDHGRGDHNGAQVSSEIQRDRCLVGFLGVPDGLPICRGGGQSARADCLQTNRSHVREGTGSGVQVRERKKPDDDLILVGHPQGFSRTGGFLS